MGKYLLTLFIFSYAFAQSPQEKRLLSKAGFNFLEQFPSNSKTKLITEFNKTKPYISKIDLKKNSARTFGKYSVGSFPEVVQGLYDSSYDGLGKKDKKQFLNNLMKEFYPRKNLVNTSQCNSNSCVKLYEVLDLYEGLITSMIEDIYGQESTQHFCSQRKTFIGSVISGTKIDDLFESVRQVEQCRELKVGDVKLVETGNLATVTGTPQQYAIKRTSDKEYEVSFNIAFPENEKGEKLYKRVNKCLEDVSTSLQSGTGEFIRLKVLTPAQSSKIPLAIRSPLINISIYDQRKSSKSNYNSTIDCPTILHELLHYTGLTDEYYVKSPSIYTNKETGEIITLGEATLIRNTNPENVVHSRAVSCRAVPSKKTIMGEQHPVFREILGRNKLSCKCITASCKAAANSGSLGHHFDYQSNTPFNGKFQPFKSWCKTLEKSTTTHNTLAEIKYAGSPLKLFRDLDNILEFKQRNITKETSGKFTFNEKHVQCSCNSSNCLPLFGEFKKMIKNSNVEKLNGCPKGSTKLDSAFISWSYKAGSLPKPKDQFEVIRDNNNLSNVLAPAHFERIKWGNCKTKATKYSKCAQGAYEMNCADVPAYCKDESQWLMSTK